MSDITTDDVRRELAIMKHVEGIDHTKSKALARRLEGDPTSKQVANRLKRLLESGDVSKWSESRNVKTWRIEL